MPPIQSKPHLMDTFELAREAKSLRERHSLTQKQLAERLISAGYKKTDRSGRGKAGEITVQAISQAESERIGASLNGLRVAIIKELSGRDVEGPVWYFRDEVTR